MSQEEIEPKLAKLMSDIAEVEGIFAFDMNGNLISGQTIDEEMDKKAIASKVNEIIDQVNKLGELIGKGNLFEMKLELQDGLIDVVVGSDLIVGAFIDQDSKSQFALISRSIKNLLGV
ncbi:MAG: hypothetical protein ACTSRZ_00695 [Promethearchaeota archaeon]